MSAELSAMFREAAEAIENAELARIRREYGNTWHIWRSAHDKMWCASTRDQDGDHSPTLVGDTAEELETHLKAPPRKFGRPASVYIQAMQQELARPLRTYADASLRPPPGPDAPWPVGTP